MAVSEIAHCRRCGKTIKWIDMTSGKKMPVDVPSVRVYPNKYGKDVFVTADGTIVRGDGNCCPEFIERAGVKEVRGWTSHFATCRGRR